MGTKRSFKRKAITICVALFLLISVITTGFATWVVSTNATGETEGNVQIGVVSDGKLTIDKLEFQTGKNEFSFNPLEGDNSGRVRAKADEGYEKLSVSFDVEISPEAFLGNVKIELVPNEDFTAAASKGYLVLPAEMVEGGIALSESSITRSGGKATFTHTITFAWGATFGGVNPSKYYDEVEAGKLVADDVVTKTLEDLRATLLGYSDELAAAEGAEARKAVIDSHAAAVLKFTVKVYAFAN